MDTELLVVPGPGTLPQGLPHEEAIDQLCRDHAFVILLQFGDSQYKLSPSYILPSNAKLVEYDYETLDQTLETLEQYLSGFGVGLVSRHKRDTEPLPFILTGSILKVPSNVTLSFLKTNTKVVPKKVEVEGQNDWDLL